MALILVVDPADFLRRQYTEELEAEGYEVLAVASGSEALQVVREQNVDLVVLEAKLGEENGIEYLRRMYEIRPSLSSIINTAYSLSYKDDMGTWLADAFLVKGPDTAELRAKVHELLVRRSTQ